MPHSVRSHEAGNPVTSSALSPSPSQQSDSSFGFSAATTTTTTSGRTRPASGGPSKPPTPMLDSWIRETDRVHLSISETLYAKYQVKPP